jgi:uncharacterized protein YqjF (DUF2071 family)
VRHPALEETDHRPWPLPDRSWSWRQSWVDLLFAHWPVPASELARLVPRGLTLQEWDGSAWLGVVPFRMTGVTRRPLPPVPGLSAFPELNVRTYVERHGKAGVWFLSLDAGNRLAVHVGRTLFHLPYHHARFDVSGTAEWIGYAARRTAGDVRFRASYGPRGEPYRAPVGTLERWLTERYCLFARSSSGRILRTDVHHRPWPLQPAEVAIADNGLAAVHGIRLPSRPPLVHFSRRLDVVVWSPEES